MKKLILIMMAALAFVGCESEQTKEAEALLAETKTSKVKTTSPQNDGLNVALENFNNSMANLTIIDVVKANHENIVSISQLRESVGDRLDAHTCVQYAGLISQAEAHTVEIKKQYNDAILKGLPKNEEFLEFMDMNVSLLDLEKTLGHKLLKVAKENDGMKK